MLSSSIWLEPLKGDRKMLSRVIIKISKLPQLVAASSISQRPIAPHLELPQCRKVNPDIQTCKTTATNKESSGSAVTRMKARRWPELKSRQLPQGRQQRPKSSQTHITSFNIAGHNTLMAFNLTTFKMCKFLIQFKRQICPEIK